MHWARAEAACPHVELTLLVCAPEEQPGRITQDKVSHRLPHQFFAALSLQLDTGKTLQAIMRFDTDVELTYFHNGGILNYMIRKMAK